MERISRFLDNELGLSDCLVSGSWTRENWKVKTLMLFCASVGVHRNMAWHGHLTLQALVDSLRKKESFSLLPLSLDEYIPLDQLFALTVISFGS